MDFIGHHRFAVARPTEHDPAFTFAASDCFCRRANKKRIIHGVFIECAEVFYFVAERAEQFFYFFFITKTGVVGAERDFHEFVIPSEVEESLIVVSNPVEQKRQYPEMSHPPPTSQNVPP